MGRGNGVAGSRLRRTRDGRVMRVRTKGAQWSEEAEQIFFDHLAASCNVTAAAAAAGFGHTTVYRYRLLRPEFAARWQAALAQGYARLEMALLEAAIDSLRGIEFDADRPIPRMTVDQAIDLLRQHQKSVMGERHPGERARRVPFEEVRAGILKKVEAIRNAGSVEQWLDQRRIPGPVAGTDPGAAGPADRDAEPG